MPLHMMHPQQQQQQNRLSSSHRERQRQRQPRHQQPSQPSLSQSYHGHTNHNSHYQQAPPQQPQYNQSRSTRQPNVGGYNHHDMNAATAAAAGVHMAGRRSPATPGQGGGGVHPNGRRSPASQQYQQPQHQPQPQQQQQQHVQFQHPVKQHQLAQQNNEQDTSTAETTTMISDIAANLGNDDLTDFTLVAKDGTRIPAARFVLGARSPVFRSLLFGNGKEARSDMIVCGYSGTVVRGLVDFCSKDDVPHFQQQLEVRDGEYNEYMITAMFNDHTQLRDDQEYPPPREYQVRQIVHLYDCARYYQLQSMEIRVCELATSFLQSSTTNKHLACALFDEASKHPAANRIKRIALHAIRSDPAASLLRQPVVEEEEEEEEVFTELSDDTSEMTIFGPNGERQPKKTSLCESHASKSPSAGVLFLTNTTLQEVLRDNKMSCEEITLFRAILHWTEPSYHEPLDMTQFADFHANFNSTSDDFTKRGKAIRKQQQQSNVKFGRRSTKGRPPASPSSSRPQDNNPMDKDRFEFAKDYVMRYIDLSKISPSDLVGIVTESGLVGQDVIWNAMSEIALRMEKGGAPLSKNRYKGNGIEKDRDSPITTTTGATTTSGGLNQHVPIEIAVEDLGTDGHEFGNGGNGTPYHQDYPVSGHQDYPVPGRRAVSDESSSNSIQAETAMMLDNANALRRGRSDTPRHDPTNAGQQYYETNTTLNPSMNHFGDYQNHIERMGCGMMDPRNGRGGSNNNTNRGRPNTVLRRSPTPPGIFGIVDKLSTELSSVCTGNDFMDAPSYSSTRTHHTYPNASGGGGGYNHSSNFR